MADPFTLIAKIAAIAVLLLLAIVWRIRIENRRKAGFQMALDDFRDRYRTLTQNTTDGVICHDAAGMVISANPAAEAILGMTEAAMQALGPWANWGTVTREDGTPCPSQEMPCAVALRSGKHVEDTILGARNARTGEPVWVQLEAFPVQRPGDVRPRQVIALFMDITATRQNQAQLIREKSLSEDARIFADVKFNISHGLQDVTLPLAERSQRALQHLLGLPGLGLRDHCAMFLLDADQTCLERFVTVGAFPGDFLHPGQAVLLGDGWYGTAVEGSKVILSDHSDEQSGRERAFAGIAATTHYVLPLMIGTQCLGIIFVGAQPDTGSDSQRLERLSQLAGLFTQAILIDQTTRILRQAKIDAEAASQAKSRFLATISHELRTPMNGVLGMAQLLLMPGVEEDERREYARTILDAGHSLLGLLNEVLDLSKVESGKMDLQSVAFAPGQLLDDVTKLFMEPARRKSLSLTATNMLGAEGRYLGDPARLLQMLSNLVSNAVKFTHAGAIEVGAELSSSGDQIRFSVRDTGIGIAAEKHDLLFQPFSQIDNSSTRVYEGTGLGLSIVQSLAKLMGGGAGCNSQPNQGSTFWFCIPAQPFAPGQETRRIARPVDLASGLAGLDAPVAGHVLVAENNPTNRKVIEAMLGKLRYTVILVDNGQEALEAIKSGQAIDLILMDCQMPLMDGYEATAAIRQWELDRQRGRLPIVALTGAALEGDRDRCLAVGMDDYLTKPLNFNALNSLLDQWIKRKSLADK